MKKVLLASSALVAGAAFAAPAMAADGEIVWSAFTQFHASSTGVDSDSGLANGDTDKGVDFNTNSEIHLNAQTTADNGLTYGLHIELEADQNGNGNADENDIWVSGDFGKVVLGDNDSAGDNLKVNASSVGFTYGMFANYTGSVLNQSSVSTDARTGTGFADGGDSTKITYFTPTFNGFKAGISYAPDGGEGRAESGGEVGSFQHHIDGGINYSGSFNDFTIDAGIGGGTQERYQNGQDDRSYWGVSGGVKVGYAGFSAAVSYSHEDEEDNFDNDTVDLGLGYATGPWGFTVGASFSDVDYDTGAGTDSDNHAYSAGVTYEIAPGLNTWVGGTVGEYENGAEDFTNIQTGLAVSF